MASFSFNQSPEDAVKYFNSKGYALSFSYTDLFKDEHLTAFTIAKMMDSDLLADVQKLLDRSLDAGKSFNWFKSNVTDLLTKAGWMGRQMQFDPISGASGIVQLGSASRIETIFRTNMQSAFAAGEWGSISDTATEFPFLMYDAIEDGRVRPEHNEWDSKVFPVNHPFWETHYPPNGYNCRCSVIQLTDDDLEELGIKPETSFDPDPVEWVNPRTGEMFYIPKGIDPSFDYNAGKLRQNMITRLLSDKAFKLPVTMRSNMVRWLEAEIKRKRAAGQSVAGYQAAINRLNKLIGTDKPTPKPKAAPKPKAEVKPKLTEVPKPLTVEDRINNFSNANDLSDYLQKLGYAEFISFGKMDLRAAKEAAISLHNHLTQFPELKRVMAFYGSAQVGQRLNYEMLIESMAAKYRGLYPDKSEIEIQALVRRRVKKERTGGEWASSRTYYGGSGYDGVYFNEQKMKSAKYAEMILIMERDVKSKFHPISCDTIKSIADHELGHRLDHLLGIRKNPIIARAFREWSGDVDELSRYGRKNIAEFIAEAWAEFINNPKPRKWAVLVGEVILDEYKKRFG